MHMPTTFDDDDDAAFVDVAPTLCVCVCVCVRACECTLCAYVCVVCVEATTSTEAPIVFAATIHKKLDILGVAIVSF